MFVGNMKKVTISGYINETFVGTNEQVEKYLVAIKKRQMSCVSEVDLKFYNKDAPTVRRIEDYSSKIYSYSAPTPNRTDFREKYNPLGLKIKIEPHDENKFF